MFHSGVLFGCAEFSLKVKHVDATVDIVGGLKQTKKRRSAWGRHANYSFCMPRIVSCARCVRYRRESSLWVYRKGPRKASGGLFQMRGADVARLPHSVRGDAFHASHEGSCEK